ncbi:MAG TPA: AAA family ATPase [Capillimicrobium sp.]|nr:AAA family ATPase [Capillimicrobium sp.]
MLEGRSRELATLTERLAALRAGRSFALLLHGDPGIGKTTLLQAAADRALEDGFLVLRASGFEAETDVAYGGLRRLVEPLLVLRDRLPAGQAQALGSALGLEPPSAHDRFAIPVSLLALLGLAAGERPLLAIVDDVQWLDPASREAILFAARRLGPAPVGLLLAARDAEGAAVDAPGVDRLPVGPLDAASSRAVLERGSGALSAAVVDQVAEAAAGNPLALVEIAAALTPDQRAGRAPIDAPLRLGPLLEEAFARRAAGLPEPARRAITVAAAMESGPVGWLLEALEELFLDESALDAAERSQTLSVADGIVSFRHPLVRAAAYHAAGEEERRVAHQVLAASARDPARRAWHLAAAAGSADAGVAAALEEAAVHARAVGGHAEAASAFERAAELSTGERDRARRQLEAAHDLVIAGQPERALRLLESASRRAGQAERGRIARLRGNIAMRAGDPERATRDLVAEAERQLAAGERELAATLLFEASVGPMMTGDIDGQLPIIERAREAAGDELAEPQVLADLLMAEWYTAKGRDADAIGALARVVPRIDEVDLLASSEVVGMAAQCALLVGEHDTAERILDRLLAACREASALGRLAYPLTVHAQLVLRAGRGQEAFDELQEAIRLATETGQDSMLAFAHAMMARLLAGAGQFDAARASVEAALRAGRGTDGLDVHTRAAEAYVELVAGEPEAALAAVRATQAIERRRDFGQWAFTMVASDAVEALVELGRRDEAQDELERLAAWTAHSGSRWGRMATARGRVLLAGDDEVDAVAADAVAAAAGFPWAFEAARTDLAIGERLRRLRRRNDAREPLDRALTVFERLGAQPFVRRTRAALEATGTSRRSETAAGLAALSTPERRIAELVAQGRTNREIAAELILSEKTLERRLTALYRRLGIASRNELARLAAGD